MLWLRGSGIGICLLRPGPLGPLDLRSIYQDDHLLIYVRRVVDPFFSFNFCHFSNLQSSDLELSMIALTTTPLIILELAHQQN